MIFYDLAGKKRELDKLINRTKHKREPLNENTFKFFGQKNLGEKRKMKKLKNKIVAITISMLFILSMTASLMLIPSASAITSPSTVATWAYVHVGPDPTGIGRPVTVGFWLSFPPPDASGPYGDRWMDMTVTITSPDGTNKTLGPFNTDDTGGTSTIFTPTTTGTYTFQAHFPGQT